MNNADHDIKSISWNPPRHGGSESNCASSGWKVFTYRESRNSGEEAKVKRHGMSLSSLTQVRFIRPFDQTKLSGPGC
jgi:hypothetical protein